MISIIQKDKAFWVLGGLKDFRRIFDADKPVAKSVQDQKQLAQVAHVGQKILLSDIVNEAPADYVWSATQFDFRSAFRLRLG